MTNIVLLLLLGGIAWLLWPRKRRETAQDLLDFKEIYDDGLIELPGQKFRLVLEVEPANLALRSRPEQAAFWVGMRGMLAALGVPCTFLVQTRHVDLRDYLARYRAAAERAPEAVRAYGLLLADWLARETEGKHLRDRRYYLILKHDGDPLSVAGGVEADHPLLNEAAKLVSRMGRSSLPAEDVRQAARDRLFDAASLAAGVFSGFEVGVRVLRRREVLEMLYATFNRDLALAARLEDAVRSGGLELLPVSETPGAFLADVEVELELQASPEGRGGAELVRTA